MGYEARIEKDTTQDLGVAVLDYTTDIGQDFILDEVRLKFDASATETITLTKDAGKGTNYDVVMQVIELIAGTSVIFAPEFGAREFTKGDKLRVQCTQNGSANVYVLVKAKAR